MIEFNATTFLVDGYFSMTGLVLLDKIFIVMYVVVCLTFFTAISSFDEMSGAVLDFTWKMRAEKERVQFGKLVICFRWGLNKHPNIE